MINNPLKMMEIRNPLIRGLIKKISKINVLEQWYDDWLLNNNGEHGNADDFIKNITSRLNVHADIIDKHLLDSIPKTGPIIIVSNHPLGGLDGILLIKVLQELRPDLKVLTNKMLTIFPEFDNIFIGVDILNKGKQRENARGVGQASQHVSNDGALLIFPAGTVSRLSLPSLNITDASWNVLITKLCCKYNAPIMPVFIDARNSLPFYLSGFIHKFLRTMLLPRAMLNKAGSTIPIHIGALIPAKDIKRLTDTNIATHYIRMCCEVLKTQPQTDDGLIEPIMSTIKPDIDQKILATHIETLSDHLIYSNNEFDLYCAPYQPLGPVMEQLAIERERTFRQVDEGTGHELDSDRFDPYYQHLFLWDKDKQKIAGGYRLSKTDEIIKNSTIDGLYSHSLFDYNHQFLENMGNTIEVGRSFITPEYQRHAGALDMLWRGIGRYVAKNPEYHTLFGCVSISQQYSKLVSALLTETFLSHYGVENSIKRNVKARTPIDDLKTPWTKNQLEKLSSIPIINKLVGRIDTGQSIPVLIRHYLALNGRFISFTVNKGFNRSLDGLIMVDLRNAPDRYLKRYMGEDGLETFKQQWKVTKDVA